MAGIVSCSNASSPSHPGLEESLERSLSDSEVTPLLSARGSSAEYISSSLINGARALQSVGDGTNEEVEIAAPSRLMRPVSVATTSSVDGLHCHPDGDDAARIASVKSARRKLMIASAFCLLFTVSEAAGGLISGSLALLTDAAHMLSDFASFLISLFAIWVAQKPATKSMSFGFYRAEVVGALTSVFIIWILTGVLVYKAIERVQTGEHNINAKVMLITSGFGVAVNILLGCILHQSGSGHLHSHGGSSHGHSHGSSNSSDGGEENINVRAAFIHVIGDMVQSVGVLIAAYIIYYYPQYSIVDPICTFLFSGLVLLTTLSVFRDGIHVLMEGSPKNISYSSVKSDLEAIEGVMMAHSLHMWCLTMGKSALAVHLVVEPGRSALQQEVLEKAQNIARNKYNMIHTTVQVEVYHRDMDSCRLCQDPKD
eukprot:scpid57515/ scgid11904/ Zinc transporter 2; Solute carrier family 30 member 2